MNNMTRFEPFAELTRFDPFLDIDEVLNRFVGRPLLRGALETGSQIKMDVKEVDGEYRIDAEIPGVKKDDIHVSIEGKRVSISAEIKHEKETKGAERLLRSERNFGMATRTFNLSDEVDQNRIQAKYTNGVLELTLPKKAGAARKEISIS